MNKLYIGAALLVSTFSFAQKNEIKAAEKALKSNNFTEAKNTLTSAEGLIANADAKTQAKFYYLKAKAFYGNAAKPDENLEVIKESIDKVKSVEGNSNGKYSVMAGLIESKLVNDVLTVAIIPYKINLILSRLKLLKLLIGCLLKILYIFIMQLLLQFLLPTMT